MTNRKALRMIHLTQPRRFDQVKMLFPDLREIGDGSYRTAYQIPQTDLVVKVEKQWSLVNYHNNYNEIEAAQLLSMYPQIRRHLPSIYYYNYELIVMRRYEMIEPVIAVYRKLICERTPEDDDVVHRFNFERKRIQELIQAAQSKVADADLHECNIARDRRGNLKIIDLGNFFIYDHKRETATSLVPCENAA